MTLIAMLISLAVDRFFAPGQKLQYLIWFSNFSRWLRATLGAFGDNAFGVLLTVILPVLAVWLIYLLIIEGVLLLGFVFAVLVLIYSLGPKNLEQQIDAYVEAMRRGGSEAAEYEAEGILHEDISRSAFRLQRAIVESILLQANERIFAVLFWFAVLGPAGALLYRLACVLKNATLAEHQTSRYAQAARRLHSALDWIPARLAALGYAITGSFVDALANWRNSKAAWLHDWEASNAGTLLASGLGALKLESETGEGTTAAELSSSATAQIKSAQGLVWRTLAGWLVVIALMTLAGWAS